MEFEGVNFTSSLFYICPFFIHISFFNLSKRKYYKNGASFFSFAILIDLLNSSFSMIIETFQVAQINFAALGNVNSGMTISYIGQFHLCTIPFMCLILGFIS